MQAPMSTGVSFSQIAMVLGTALACLWAATQWTAAALGYQPALGTPWFVVAGVPCYPPWALFVWWYAFDAYAPHVFLRAGAIAAAGGVLPIGMAVGVVLFFLFGAGAELVVALAARHFAQHFRLGLEPDEGVFDQRRIELSRRRSGR